MHCRNYRPWSLNFKQSLQRYNPEVGDLVVGRITEVRVCTSSIAEPSDKRCLGTAPKMESRCKLKTGRRSHVVLCQPAGWCSGTVINSTHTMGLSSVMLASKIGKRRAPNAQLFRRG
jgi:hypothetical protein